MIEPANQSANNFSDEYMIYYTDVTYLQCVLTISSCELLKTAGSLLGLFAIPSIFLGLIGNVILQAALCYKSTLTIQEKMFLIFYSCNDILYMLIPWAIDYFPSKGVPWLGQKGYYMQHNVTGCKMAAFLRTFFTATFSNLLLAEALIRVMSFIIVDNVLLNVKEVMLAMFLSVGFGFIHTTVTFMLSNIWYAQDGRSLCSTDPRWVYEIVTWGGIHDVLFCDGAVQMLVVIICNCFIVRALYGIKNNQLMLKYAIKKTQLTPYSATLENVKQVMYRVHRNIDFYLIHSNVMVLVKIAIAIANYFLFRELYVNYENNSNLQGVGLYYASAAAVDILKSVDLTTRVCYVWLVMLRIPELRHLLKFGTWTLIGSRIFGRERLSDSEFNEKNFRDKLLALRLSEINELQRKSSKNANKNVFY